MAGPHPRIMGGLLPWGPQSHKISWTSVLKEIWIVMTHSESHIAKIRLGLVGL